MGNGKLCLLVISTSLKFFKFTLDFREYLVKIVNILKSKTTDERHMEI